VLERDLVVVPETDKAGPEAVSDPDGGMTDDAATEPGTDAFPATLLFPARTLLEAATAPLLEAATAALLEAATPALLEAAMAPLLEAAIAPLLEAAMAPLLLLGTMLDAGTEALRVLVAENVELEHWKRITRL